MPDLRLLDVMLFDYGTTNRIDFRYGDINVNPYQTVYKEKPKRLRKRAPPLKDIHTLSDWKTPNIQFSLLIKPKEIIRTNPRHVQERYEPLPDLCREEAQKTRPRVVMTPAISMDDINKPEIRNFLIENVYKSTTQRAYCDSTSKGEFNNREPFPGLPAPANPITLETLGVPYVSPEWRMESASWDGRQLRAHCDPTREFHIARPLRCQVCKVTAAVGAQRKLNKQMKRR